MAGLLYLLEEVNGLTSQEFLQVFVNVVEDRPDVARHVAALRPFSGVEQLTDAALLYLDTLSLEENMLFYRLSHRYLFHTGKEEVLRCHPDLAGRLAEEGKLTAESAREQHAAGLHKLTPEDKRDIDQLNKRYKEKFGFPFVICARENKANAILLGLKRRVDNSKDCELEEGIQEVKKICRLRICELVSL
uniref:2-oxo-4-hydroxy-4-carboxy-5-ureidoimidazoline decarboxylase n=1 Tax=Timema douglasi TaxID=61478 RepID=A0A7R8VTL1_TIMDO|nr:unnamed protein product [Timema douglasi]